MCPTIPPKKDNVVSQDDLDENLESAIKSAIFEHSKGKGGFDAWLAAKEDYYISDPDARGVTAEEAKTAKNARMYGRVVCFVGVLYDEDQCELLGECYMLDAKGKSVTRECLFRGVQKSYAEHAFINTNQPMAMTVVGQTESFIPHDRDILLVSELTESGKGLLMDKVKETVAN